MTKPKRKAEKRAARESRRETRSAEAVDARTQALVHEQIAVERRRSYESGYAEGYSDGGNDETPPASTGLRSYGYRRLSGTGGREFAIDPQRILDVAWSLYQSNPVAARTLLIKVGYILGAHVQVQYGDDRVKGVCEQFMEENKLDLRFVEFVRQLHLFGEQMFPVFVKESSSGEVTLAYIDPADIEDVLTHPDNAMEVYAVVVREQLEDTSKPWLSVTPRRVYRVVRKDKGAVIEYPVCPYCGSAEPADQDGKCVGCGYRKAYVAQPRYPGRFVTARQAVLENWEQQMLQAYGLRAYSGTCFLVQINKVSNQTRGFSDFLQIMDWLDAVDETLFSLADRENMAGYVTWDVTLAEATQEDVDKKASKIKRSVPKRGQANVHNTSETWELKYPDLKQGGSIETAEALETHALGGVGIPRHWYGKGGDTTYATAAAQGDPTWRTLELEQMVVRAMILGMLEFARDQAEIAGALRYIDQATGTLLSGEALRKARTITVVMPEMTRRDVTAAASALSALAAAVVQLIDAGLGTRQRGLELIAKVAAELGVEIDPEAELAAVEREQARQGTAQAEALARVRAEQLQARMAQYGDGSPADGERAPIGSGGTADGGDGYRLQLPARASVQTVHAAGVAS